MNDIKKLVQSNRINGSLSIQDSVSNFKVTVDFERREVSMTAKVTPPLNKDTVARFTWLRISLITARKGLLKYLKL